MSDLLKPRKLLMLSAKDSEIPFILAARKMGYYVITTGYKKDRSGHKYANEYVPFDFSDYDGLAEMSRDLGIDVLCQGCNDHCALSASAVGTRLGFGGHDSLEVTEILHRKDRFKEYAKRAGLPSPVSEWFDTLEEGIEFGKTLKNPYIVKPVDSAGGAGVSVARDQQEFEDAVRNAFAWSAEGRIVAEPYIEGTLHSLSTFLVDGRVVAAMTANDYSFKNPYLTNSGKFPADGHDDAVATLVPIVEGVAKDLDLVDGLLHLQYMRDADGRLWIIEMMRRSPGNYYFDALSQSTGINWLEWVIRAEAGDDVSAFPQARVADSVYAYHSIMAPADGVLACVEIDDDIRKYVYQYVEWNGPGSTISDFMNEKIGSLQLRFPDEATADAVMGSINEHVRAVIE